MIDICTSLFIMVLYMHKYLIHLNIHYLMNQITIVQQMQYLIILKILFLYSNLMLHCLQSNFFKIKNKDETSLDSLFKSNYSLLDDHDYLKHMHIIVSFLYISLYIISNFYSKNLSLFCPMHTHLLNLQYLQPNLV